LGGVVGGSISGGEPAGGKRSSGAPLTVTLRRAELSLRHASSSVWAYSAGLEPRHQARYSSHALSGSMSISAPGSEADRASTPLCALQALAILVYFSLGHEVVTSGAAVAVSEDWIPLDIIIERACASVYPLAHWSVPPGLKLVLDMDSVVCFTWFSTPCHPPQVKGAMYMVECQPPPSGEPIPH
jgi:hypothetical protein